MLPTFHLSKTRPSIQVYKCHHEKALNPGSMQQSLLTMTTTPG